MLRIISNAVRARGRVAEAVPRCLATVSLWALTVVSAAAQSAAAAPSKTACKGWDNAFLTTFHMVFALVFIGTFVLSLGAPLVVGRLFWWITASRARILWITLTVLVVSIVLVVVYPRLIGLGNFGYSGVNPKYLDCEGMQFGAAGLFGGLIGRDVAAISQWPAMIALLALGALAGGILSFLVSETLVKSLGITSKVSGGEV